MGTRIANTATLYKCNVTLMKRNLNNQQLNEKVYE